MQKFTKFSDDTNKQDFIIHIEYFIQNGIRVVGSFELRDYNETYVRDCANKILSDFPFESVKITKIEKI